MTPILECPKQDNGLCKHKNARKGNILKKLGPGFITGASDDDPSGLTTYAQSGAQFGAKILWLAPWSLPLMISVQEMAGRIGLMTQGGLARALVQKLPRYVVYFMISSLVIANTINIGADIAGMAESVQMITGIPFSIAAIVLSVSMLFLQIYMPYKRYINLLKWCTITLFSYMVAVFSINMEWGRIAWHTLVPTIKLASNDFWYLLTAILGTTISPYLLFWQASQEIEEKRVRDERENRVGYAVYTCEVSNMREETFIGMFFSNLIMFFVIAVTGVVLHDRGGASTINSMVEAADALRPLAGDMAAWLFGVGIIGTGLMSVPVLAGSSAYAISELFGWRHGLHLQWHEARKFYAVIGASTLIGLALNGLKINAVDFLIWSAIINGCVTPIIIVGMIIVGNDGNMLGKFKNSRLAQCGAWLTFTVFTASIAGFLLTYKKQGMPYENLWREEATHVAWFKPPTKILEWREPFAIWFGDGEINASYACVDIHVAHERKDKTALIWENEVGDSGQLTYGDLYRDVNRVADVLKRFGVKRGQTVLIYMPNTPAAVVAMLAVARIGAIHVVVPANLRGHALKQRLEDCKAQLIITADGHISDGSFVPLKNYIDKVLEDSKQVLTVLVHKSSAQACPMMPGRDFFVDEVINKKPRLYVKPEAVMANHPLFVLYTAHGASSAKGILHSTGGYLTFVRSTLVWTFGVDDSSVYWCTADLSTIAGHSYAVYGPLQLGATIMLYDGAVDKPSKDRWWDIIDRHEVTHLYSSPASLRPLMLAGSAYPARHNLSSLQKLGSFGEALTPELWDWYHDVIGSGHCPIIDTWWQTETGGIMIAPMPHRRPMKLHPGTVGRPLPGIDVEVVSQSGKPVAVGEAGALIIKTPWPGMSIGIYGDYETFSELYWSKYAEAYYTGDIAAYDQEGNYKLLGRADQVVKRFGYRFGLAEIEAGLLRLPQVLEAAVVALPDDREGQCLVGFVLLRESVEQSAALEALCKQTLKEQLSPLATPKKIYFVRSLPKDNAGAIMRATLVKMLEENNLQEILTVKV